MRRDRLQKMENSRQVEAANRVHAVATDKRGVTRSQPQIHDGPRNALSVAKAKSRSSLRGSL